MISNKRTKFLKLNIKLKCHDYVISMDQYINQSISMDNIFGNKLLIRHGRLDNHKKQSMSESQSKQSKNFENDELKYKQLSNNNLSSEGRSSFQCISHQQALVPCII